MLTLLSPAGLWALAALALPLALHLWRRPPRVVRLGSLRFLERAARRPLRDLRWNERILLVTRLLMLTLLALMLTRPHWNPASLNRPQNWALIDPGAALMGPSLERLRALQSAGWETHSLSPGFPKATNAGSAAGSVVALWSLLREVDAGLPRGSELAVFTPGRLASLRGDRPALFRTRAEWVITPARGAAKPAETRPTTTPLTVSIFHDTGREEDARFLAAAVRAVGQVSGRDIFVVEKSKPERGAAAGSSDWTFWLGDEPPSSIVASSAMNLVTDAEGNPSGPDTNPGWIVPQAGTPGAEAFLVPVRLWRRVPAQTDALESVIWTDSFGEALLARSSDGTHRRWHFYSRFDPDWTDLPNTTALPEWLRGLLLPELNAPLFADPAHDFRTVDPTQLAPTAAPAGSEAVVLPLRRDTPGLQGWCWLVSAMLFCVERILSHRRPAARTAAANPRTSHPEPELVQ